MAELVYALASETSDLVMEVQIFSAAPKRIQYCPDNKSGFLLKYIDLMTINARMRVILLNNQQNE